jgi:ABC-2 type transport system ATP-binding protein
MALQLDVQPVDSVATDGPALTAPTISLRHLTKRYRGGRGIEDLSFDVRPGEVFGFLGPNGAGKTTAIRVLLDLLRPTGGTATVLGFDSRRDGVEIRRHVGYLPGDLRLYERLTAREMLMFLGRLDPRRSASTRELEAEVEQLAGRLALDLDRPVRSLSRGNKQKVGLVQALVGSPALLVLDEPTSGLDPLVQEEFHRLLREAADEGRTVLLSSHQLAEVQQIADRVAIIRDGRLVIVEDVGTLRIGAPRRIEIHFGGPAPDASRFSSIEGVIDVQRHSDRVRLSMRGSMGPLLREVARHDVIDLVTEETSLDAVFLGFYDPSRAVQDG